MSADRPPREPSDPSFDGRPPGDDRPNTGEVDRRTLFRLGALAGAGASLAGARMWNGVPARAQEAGPGADAAAAATPEEIQAAVAAAPSELNEATIAELQQMMAHGHLSATELVEYYIQRIEALDRRGPKVNAVLEINPDAIAIAQALDKERRSKGPRGPMHGIPMILKDNIDTADKLHTTAGSFALLGPAPPQDSTVAARLRAAGAVILGKAGLSEWANFRSTHSSSGWSGRGGQVNNPYILDRNPCGSSAGSGASTSANFTAAALATETDGSIVCPASMNGVVGIKTTLGLTSRAGVVPISHDQDVVGPHGRTVADAATVLGSLVGVDPRDPATAASAGHFFTDYTQFLDPNALKGARLGVARITFTGYSDKTDESFEDALDTLRAAGATIVDPADLPSIAALTAGVDETNVLFYDFPFDIAAYLATRVGLGVHNLDDLIAFNNAHADIELQYFGQEIFLACQNSGITAAQYQQSLINAHTQAREQGIDAVLQQFNLDAIVTPTGTAAFTTDLVLGDHFQGADSTPAAVAGYPHITVPGGTAFGLPIGLSFTGTAWSEPKLIALAYAYEQATKVRQQPKFLPTLPASARFGTRAAKQPVPAMSRRMGNWLDSLPAGSPVPRRLGYL
ncbi:MAG TPA: amidase [Thermoanaerobaculia bacterium]|jgi:amidase|nr:amidase [Thermoanaerobaculia bacterium]